MSTNATARPEKFHNKIGESGNGTFICICHHPCEDACLGRLETLFDELGLDIIVGMDAATSKDGYCQFRCVNT